MICETCKKEMKYFADGQTCGWKCNLCDTYIVTTNNDEIEFDETNYSISIYSVAHPSAVEIKNLAKICKYSFIDAKNTLINGGIIGEFNAIETREILQIFDKFGIKYLSTPEFTHNL